MFLGHFGVALAAKKVVPGASLGTTLFAAEFLDAVWPILLVAGVEHVTIAPGITRMSPLDFTDYPWSHSLVMALAWSALFAAVYYLVRRKRAYALWLAAIVLSHWFLDWIVHRPDLPIAPGTAGRHGLDLWDSLPATLAVEGALFGAGVAIYVSSTRAVDLVGRAGFWAFVVALVALYASATFGPPPPSVQVLAWSAFGGYFLMAWAWWVDRHRRPTGAAA